MANRTFLAVVVVVVVAAKAGVGMCGFLQNDISTYCAYQSFLMYNPSDPNSNPHSLHWGTDVNTAAGEQITFPYGSGSFVVKPGVSGQGYNVFCTPGATAYGRNNCTIIAHVVPATGVVVDQSTPATLGGIPRVL